MKIFDNEKFKKEAELFATSVDFWNTTDNIFLNKIGELCINNSVIYIFNRYYDDDLPITFYKIENGRLCEKVAEIRRVNTEEITFIWYV